MPEVPEHVKTVMETIGDLVETQRWLGDTALVPNHLVRRPLDVEIAVYNRLTASDGYNDVVEKLQSEGVSAKKGRLISGRLYADAFSRTLVDLGVIVHPTEPRLITLREGARLCSYPDSFEFAPDPKNKEFGATATDVTQAVLPVMGDYLGGLFSEAFDNETPASGVQEVDWRKIARPFTPGRYAKTMGWR